MSEDKFGYLLKQEAESDIRQPIRGKATEVYKKHVAKILSWGGRHPKDKTKYRIR